MSRANYDTKGLIPKLAKITVEGDNYLKAYKVNFNRFVRQCVQKLIEGQLHYNHMYEPLYNKSDYDMTQSNKIDCDMTQRFAPLAPTKDSPIVTYPKIEEEPKNDDFDSLNETSGIIINEEGENEE